MSKPIHFHFLFFDSVPNLLSRVMSCRTFVHVVLSDPISFRSYCSVSVPSRRPPAVPSITVAPIDSSFCLFSLCPFGGLVVWSFFYY